jgi:hypothetical protein
MAQVKQSIFNVDAALMEQDQSRGVRGLADWRSRPSIVGEPASGGADHRVWFGQAVPAVGAAVVADPFGHFGRRRGVNQDQIHRGAGSRLTATTLYRSTPNEQNTMQCNTL